MRIEQSTEAVGDGDGTDSLLRSRNPQEHLVEIALWNRRIEAPFCQSQKGKREVAARLAALKPEGKTKKLASSQNSSLPLRIGYVTDLLSAERTLPLA
jgi:hypothetical protein